MFGPTVQRMTFVIEQVIQR